MHSEGKTMENKLVSVIVPVYNVETYLKRCITSLLAQSYANTEIILVDDGSTDASGKICDHYAASHPSLICLHQTNQGQSCARNAGMRIAHGDYYMFVDSDDYIEPDMIAAMVAESESRDADIVVCGYWMEYPFLSVRRRMLPKRCWNTKRGLELLQENKRIENFAWGKLYRASLLEGIVFPQCRFEDIYTLYRIFARAQRIAMLPQRMYHYVQRKKSITNTKGFFTKDAQLLREMYEAFTYQQKKIQELYPQGIHLSYRNYFVVEVLTLTSMLLCPKNEIKNYDLLTTKGYTLPERLLCRTMGQIVQLRMRNAAEKEMNPADPV